LNDGQRLRQLRLARLYGLLAVEIRLVHSAQTLIVVDAGRQLWLRSM
jgi:hypothetical protein